jgi:predicted DCC family thiol-disulfide oxidoreductase YuxK
MPTTPATAASAAPRGKPVIWNPPPTVTGAPVATSGTVVNNSTPDSGRDKDGVQIVISTPTEPQDHRPIFFYNQQCGFCRRFAAWVIKNDDPKHEGFQLLDERPIGVDPLALAKIAPTAEMSKLYDTLHVMMPDKTFLTGGAAVTEVMRRVPDLQWAAWIVDNLRLGSFKPFQLGVDLAYHIADKIRPAFGCDTCGTPVPWWGKPIVWTIQAWGWLNGEVGGKP